MNNPHTVFLIMIGTYVCAANPESFVTELGEYDWSLGVALAIAMFGVLSLLDLALAGAKHAYAIGRHSYTKWSQTNEPTRHTPTRNNEALSIRTESKNGR